MKDIKQKPITQLSAAELKELREKMLSNLNAFLNNETKAEEKTAA